MFSIWILYLLLQQAIGILPIIALAIAVTQTLYLFGFTNNTINFKAKRTHSNDTLTCIDYNAKTGDLYVGNTSGELLVYTNPAKYLLDSLRIDTIDFSSLVSVSNNNKDMLLIATRHKVYSYNINKKEIGYLRLYTHSPVLGTYFISGDDFSVFANTNSFLACYEWLNIKNEKKTSFVEGGNYQFLHAMSVGINDVGFVLDNRNSFWQCKWSKVSGKWVYMLFNNILYDTRKNSYINTAKYDKIFRFYAWKNKMIFIDSSNRLFSFEILCRDTALEWK
ncbi:MAG: hypothetical protein M0D57_16570 [Sphingobacteriales bacterium JAD_PAG50586_3]|nr:MAG: hypothetical protein M0D57_16570 [Sphingobacteriales bacterium JAD_PAG50586_3]